MPRNDTTHGDWQWQTSLGLFFLYKLQPQPAMTWPWLWRYGHTFGLGLKSQVLGLGLATQGLDLDIGLVRYFVALLTSLSKRDTYACIRLHTLSKCFVLWLSCCSDGCLLFCMLNTNSQKTSSHASEIQTVTSELLLLTVSMSQLYPLSKTYWFVMWEVQDIFNFLLINHIHLSIILLAASIAKCVESVSWHVA